MVIILREKSSISDEDSNDGNVDINVINMHWSCSVDYIPVVTFIWFFVFENFFIIQKYNFVRLLAYTYEVRGEILM